jgi:CheY-like chemotaxis protein
MSLRILFADDSMTAQNMGKKILTDAGYEVVAVSNGAAAVKKIAEQKPDIIILDVYMPGYNGLEVCEKVRASIDTLKTPVLLTVGKMEPYRAEDANRVKADGVIIKPFEASDLLAIVKKLEERVVPKSIPLADQTIRLERPPDFSQFAVNPAVVEPEARSYENESTVQASVEVPDHMATSAAFSDLLGMEPEHSLDPLPVPRNASTGGCPCIP